MLLGHVCGTKSWSWHILYMCYTSSPASPSVAWQQTWHGENGKRSTYNTHYTTIQGSIKPLVLGMLMIAGLKSKLQKGLDLLLSI